MTNRVDEIGQQLQQVLRSLSCASRPVRLVAVSKTMPVEDVLAAYQAGQRYFGESYLPKDICWRFIGALQSNKIKMLATVGNLDAIETVDSTRKAYLLEQAFSERDNPLDVFLQVNTSGEPNKHGHHPDEALPLAGYVVAKCPHLRLAGLMTIGSACKSQAKEANSDFDILLRCRDTIQLTLDSTGIYQRAGGQLDIRITTHNDIKAYLSSNPDPGPSKEMAGES